MPAFSSKRMRDFQPMFWRRTKTLLKVIEEVISQYPTRAQTDWLAVEVKELMSNTTLDVIGEAAFSLDFQATAHMYTEHGENRILDDYRRIFMPSDSNRFRMYLAFVLPRFILCRLPIKRNREVTESLGGIHPIVEDVIAAKHKARKQAVDHGVGLPKKDMLDFIMSSESHQGLSISVFSCLTLAGCHFDDEMLRNTSLALLAAGHETTASTLTSVIYWLSRPQHEGLQRRLRDEIRARIPSPNREEPAAAQLFEDFPLLSAIRNETLRTHAPFILLISGLHTIFYPQFVSNLVHFLQLSRSLNPNLNQ